MYGGEHDPDVPENKFFSDNVAALGWKLFREGDVDTAIKRFNQAWMFDRNNSAALWGFGVVMGVRAEKEAPEANLREAVKYLTMVKDRRPDDACIYIDLAISYSRLGAFLQSEKKSPESEFKTARELLLHAERLDPKHRELYSAWSNLELYTGNIPRAKELWTKAKELGVEPDPEYETTLDQAKKPEPH
jgi:tetratricopeptide (TPR) repeat protein